MKKKDVSRRNFFGAAATGATAGLAALANPGLAAIRGALVENVRTLTGVTIAPDRHVTTLRHGVTRFRIALTATQTLTKVG